MLILSAIGLSACGEDPEPPHTHSYVETVVAPTCTAKGYTLHKCACGEEYTDTEVDKLEHLYNNGKCVDCEYSIFEDDYALISQEDAVSFASELPNSGKTVDWKDGYDLNYVYDVEYDTLPETLEGVRADVLYKVNTAKSGDSALAFATGSHVYTSSTASKFEREECYYQNGRTYSEWSYTISQMVKTQKAETLDEFMSRFVGDANLQFDFTTSIQLLTGGYYDDVKFFKVESSSYIKLKIDVPEQEKNGSRNRVSIVYVYDSQYKLVSLYYELNMYSVALKINTLTKCTLTRSVDEVPTVSNTQSYECVEHEFEAGVCTVCAYDLFSHIDDIEIYNANKQNFSAFVDNVRNNSTQGEVDFKKYGANETCVNNITYNGIKYCVQENSKIQFVDEKYVAKIILDVAPDSLANPDGAIEPFTYKAYVDDKILYVEQPNILNNLGEITDFRNVENNSIIDIMLKATTLSTLNRGYVHDYVSICLPIAFDELYNYWNCPYYLRQYGNYYIVRVCFNDQYMGSIDVMYVFDEEYDLVGFKGISKSGDTTDVEIMITPLLENLEIPNEIQVKIDLFVEQNK